MENDRMTGRFLIREEEEQENLSNGTEELDMETQQEEEEANPLMWDIRDMTNPSS